MQFTRFPNLLKVANLHHAITQRDGGVSPAPFDSLNLGLHVGDSAQNVRQNRRLVAQHLEYDPLDCIFAQQTHGTNSFIVTPGDRGRGNGNWEAAIADCDALICEFSDTPVMILVADCAPILIVDARLQVLAAVHAGWRGALGGIVGKTIETMREEFGCKPHDLQVGIGPCLCTNCLEVGEEVAAQVLATLPASTCIARAGFIKPHFDLRQMICDDLASVQVLAGNIETLNICPQCAREDYFSHRGDGGKTGRFGLVAWWS